MKNIFIILIFPFILFGETLKIEDVLTEKNKIKSTLSVSYSNIHRKNNKIIPITYQTTNGDFVSIPTYMGISNTNQDFINYGINVRYGINKDLEVFSNLNLFTSNTRSSDSSFTNDSSSGFNNLSFGLNYQIKQEDETPSIIIGANTNLIERTIFMNGSKDSSFKSFSLFATSYSSVDPIIFLLDTRYRVNLKKENNSQTIENGDIITFSPSIIFVVNPYISLNWGIDYNFKNKDKMNGMTVSNSESSIGYRFGVNYELNSKKYLNINISKKDTNDYSSNNVSLALSYEF